jgi:hypothetical protein
MNVETIRDGDLYVLGPTEQRLVAFDWREVLHPTVQISTSTWVVTAIVQSGTALTTDNATLLGAAAATVALEETVTTDNVVSAVRLLGTTATAGDRYRVSNRIVSNEAPTQTEEMSITVLIQTR